MEWVSTVYHHYQLSSSKFINYRHAYICLLHPAILHDAIIAPAAVSTPKQIHLWKSKANNASTATLCKEALLEDDLDRQLVPLDFNTYVSLLEVCTHIKSIKQVHAHLFITGLDQSTFLCTKLVGMYSACCSMENARLVFDKIYKPTVLLWNVMIRGYTRNGLWPEALSLYHQMRRASIQPDNFTFCLALKACVGLSALEEGKEIHDHIVKNGFQSDVFVATALLHLYTQSGQVEVARYLFDEMSERDAVSWNAMIAGYAQTGHANEALALFKQMQLAEMKPNSVTMASALQACAHLGALQQGKWLHDYIIKSGFESNVYVGNSLVAMYAKCRKIGTARKLFDKMTQRTVVSWNAMIAGYALNGHADDALTLFYQMLMGDMTPDLVTMESVPQACAQLGDLQQAV